jgi:hypothetical protein
MFGLVGIVFATLLTVITKEVARPVADGERSVGRGESRLLPRLPDQVTVNVVFPLTNTAGLR